MTLTPDGLDTLLGSSRPPGDPDAWAASLCPHVLRADQVPAVAHAIACALAEARAEWRAGRRDSVE